MNIITTAIEKHKLIRRLIVLWAVILITWVTIRVFTSPPDISNGTAAAFASVVGLLGSSIAFYKWSRQKEEGHNDES